MALILVVGLKALLLTAYYCNMLKKYSYFRVSLSRVSEEKKEYQRSPTHSYMHVIYSHL
jgi:hypothetical protein